MDKETTPDLVIPESDEQLLAECRVETFRAGGPGGQHQNKTESGVRLVHLPSGVRAVAREERSQHRNRAKALERLRAKLEALLHREAPRKSTRVPRRQKEKRLGEKRKRGEAKQLRKRPDPERE
jgi:ribosome-associated protein